MRVVETALPGVLVVEPQAFDDARGLFFESWRADAYAAHGIGEPAPDGTGGFVQDNHSRSTRGVLRGLHFQRRHPQGKLVRVVRGAVFDVVVDLREGSPTFGRHVGFELSEENRRQVWVPPGMAHGFCTLSESADFLYKCTAYYRPDDEGGLRWDDPDLGIAWPVAAPALSEKDRQWPRLRDLAPSALPRSEAAEEAKSTALSPASEPR